MGRNEPVHPRGCGEHVRWAKMGQSVSGSSPRMRGTFCFQGLFCCLNRFIPADAGNIRYRRWFSCHRSVHPRGCGEHVCVHYGFNLCGGSSPRMRGTSAATPKTLADSRFIPADAGNIVPTYLSFSPISVHPRGCGEHVVYVIDEAQFYGSSPRMRGTSDTPGNQGQGQRFIPADAGNIISSTRHPRL